MSPTVLSAFVAMATVFMVAAVIVSCMSLWLSIENQVTVRAMEKSTHSIQYVEADALLRNKEEEEINGDINEAEHKDWDRMDEIHQKSDPLM